MGWIGFGSWLDSGVGFAEEMKAEKAGHSGVDFFGFLEGDWAGEKE